MHNTTNATLTKCYVNILEASIAINNIINDRYCPSFHAPGFNLYNPKDCSYVLQPHSAEKQTGC